MRTYYLISYVNVSSSSYPAFTLSLISTLAPLFIKGLPYLWCQHWLLVLSNVYLISDVNTGSSFYQTFTLSLISTLAPLFIKHLTIIRLLEFAAKKSAFHPAVCGHVMSTLYKSHLDSLPLSAAYLSKPCPNLWVQHFYNTLVLVQILRLAPVSEYVGTQ